MSALGIDDGLLRRLREAGRRIVWRSAGAGRTGAGPAGRIARLQDEEARVETWETSTGVTVEVEAGPVGAVVLLLEADRRGVPTALGSRNAGRSPSFPGGSIAASWGSQGQAADATPTLRDLVELARYALP